jgi:hypothetical protein
MSFILNTYEYKVWFDMVFGCIVALFTGFMLN